MGREQSWISFLLPMLSPLGSEASTGDRGRKRVEFGGDHCHLVFFRQVQPFPNYPSPTPKLNLPNESQRNVKLLT